MANLYENIKRLREKSGMSQEDLASLTGYTNRSSIAKIEKGLIDLSQTKIELFAKALKVSPGELMGWDEEQPKPDLIEYKSDQDVISKIGGTPYHPTHRVPILGYISAGLPLYAEEHIEGYTYTDLNGGNEYFALRVKGDSMNAARIYDGDLLMVRKQSMVENGNIAVVMVDGENATVKRFYKDGNQVTLMPQSTNPAHLPQVYDVQKIKIEIIGKVVENKISIE